AELLGCDPIRLVRSVDLATEDLPIGRQTG
ncbi:hypothetical protein CEXT_759581, partial [Caerostris extrusa]